MLHYTYFFHVTSLNCFIEAFSSIIDRCKRSINMLKKPIFSPIYRLKEPCDGCAAPYGYKHHMQLSTDTSTFSVSSKVDLVIRKVVWADPWVVIIITQGSAHATLRTTRMTLVSSVFIANKDWLWVYSYYVSNYISSVS